MNLIEAVQKAAPKQKEKTVQVKCIKEKVTLRSLTALERQKAVRRSLVNGKVDSDLYILELIMASILDNGERLSDKDKDNLLKIDSSEFLNALVNDALELSGISKDLEKN